MITKNIVKQPKSVVEVQVTVPWEDIAPRWNETLTKLAAETELPGFRKGQAPIPMVEQQLGGKLQEEVLKVVMPESLIQALQGTDVVPIDYPNYRNVSFTKGGPLSFIATVTQRPVVSVGDYKNIQAARPAVKQVTDEEVEKMVEEMFKRWKSRQPGTPAVQNPQTNPPQPANGSSAASGSMSFGNQPQSQPSGILNAQGAPVTPQNSTAPDDSFARSIGAQDLADLKAKLKADLEAEAKYNNELDYEESILQEVEKITSVEVPDVLINDELNRMLVSLQRRVADMGLLLEDYLKSQNKTVEGLRQEWTPQAEKNVRMELGLAEIAKQEKVDITEEELQAEIDKIQDAKLKQQFDSQEPRLHLRHSLRQIKTLDLLKTLAKTA